MRDMMIRPVWTLAEKDSSQQMQKFMGGIALDDKTKAAREEAIRKVREALEQMRYGEIIIKVNNGVPVYVDKQERVRVG